MMKTTTLKYAVIGFVLVGFLASFAAPAWAQPRPPFGHGPRPPFGPPPPPPGGHHHHGPSDFEKAIGVIGAVGAVAAIANGYSTYGYHRCSPRPVVVVPQPQPTIVVERPVVVEKPVIVERPVIVEKPVPVSSGDYYSGKLGATFIVQNMTIPGYTFKAARLMSNPVEGSPLEKLRLRKGDVITRLDNESVSSLEVLERHEKNTTIRYIKTGTTKVLMDSIYIPTDDELQSAAEETYYAP